MNFLKKEVKNKKSILLAGIALVISIIFVIVVISKNREVIWPTKEILFEQKRRYRLAKKNLKKAKKLNKEFLKEEDAVADKVKTFYKENEKLKADIYMRQRIEHAAKFSNLILKSMSSTRKKEIKGETFSIELSISAEGSFEKVIVFFQELNKKKVGFYWVNCYLRPSSSRKETLINVSGVLRMVSADGKLFETKRKTVK